MLRSYSYDDAGNLTAAPDGSTYSYDNADQLVSSSDPSGATTAYSFSTQGNRTTSSPPSEDDTSYAYDQANRLTGLTHGAHASTYSYDGDGLRTSKTVDGATTDFNWDPVTGAVPLLLSASGTDNIYGPGDLPIEQLTSAGTDYLQHDGQASTRLLTDSDGTVTGTYSYGPFGATTSHTGQDADLRYDGQYQDDEDGLYYLRARYYDPSTAQFLTRDSLEDITGQPYAYADDDPLDESDPAGLCGSHWYDEVACQTVDTFVNVGRGATGGLTDKFDNWISPGSSCTVAQNGAVEDIAFAGSLLDGEGEATLAEKSLASMEDEGRLIAGPGGSVFRDVDRVVDQYGGTADQWSKMASRKFVDSAGRRFETHWIENLAGDRFEFKTKLLEGLGYYE